MQTFLPYHPEQNGNTGEWGFASSSMVLDNRRLNKQTVEGSQILDILCGKHAEAKYRNHPAVLQWKGHEWVLLDYITDMCLECRARSFKNTIYDRLGGYSVLIPGMSSMELPDWMDREEIFASHRSRLMFKGRCDAAIKALKDHICLPKGITIRYWLISDDSSIVVSNEYVKTKQMQIQDIEQIEDFLYERRIDIPANHYKQFKWKETDRIPYVWPVTIADIREKEAKGA